jgi:hypothetical protein
MLFIISINVCYYKMSIETLDALGKIQMKFWQWLTIGLYFLALQALMYGCSLSSRVERLLLLASSSVLYFTLGVILLTLKGYCDNPYIYIISYNNLLSVVFIFMLIGALYNSTFKLNIRLKKMN